MSEDKKEQSSSRQGSSQAEAAKNNQQTEQKPAAAEVKQPPQPVPSSQAQSSAPSAAGPVAAPLPPRPAAAPLPTKPGAASPAPAPLPVPPSRPQVDQKAGRRVFLKLLVAAAAVLTLVPFVPWGQFLSSSVGSSGSPQRQQAVIDNNPTYGAAAGQPVNVNDLQTFPPNSHWVITYPSAGNTAHPTTTDATQNFQNPDTFSKFELIRLPIELGGDSKSAADFVGFSKVCVHLWCSPNYNPEQCTNPDENGYPTTGTCTPHQQYECPCHGSIYGIPNGKAKFGPASQQPAPTNAIPMLMFTSDSNGNLWIEVPGWNTNQNGVVGYGRSETGVHDPTLDVTPQAIASGQASSLMNNPNFSTYYNLILQVELGKIPPPSGWGSISTFTATSTSSSTSTG